MTAPTVTPVRTIRARAKRCGYHLTVLGDTAELFDEWVHVERERVPSYSRSLQGCADWLAEQLKALGHRPGPARKLSPPPWRHRLDQYTAHLDAAQASPETIATRVGHLASFAHRHPDGPMTVTHDHLAAWVGGRTRKPRSACSIRALMRAFFGWLTLHHHRVDNPAAHLPPIRLPRSRPRPCPDAGGTGRLRPGDGPPYPAGNPRDGGDGSTSRRGVAAPNQ